MSSFQIYIIYKQNKNITSVIYAKQIMYLKTEEPTKKTKLVMCGSLKWGGKILNEKKKNLTILKMLKIH